MGGFLGIALLLCLATVQGFVQPNSLLVLKGNDKLSFAARTCILGSQESQKGRLARSLHIDMSAKSPSGLDSNKGSKRAQIKEKFRRAKAFAVDVGITPLTARLSRKWAHDYLKYGGSAQRFKWEGKTAIITGASGGIGQQAALGLASRGFKVVLAVRNVEKGNKACNDIRNQCPDADVTVMKLDLSSLDSVREFAREFGNRDLAVLVLNAGYGGGGKGGLTQDGLEWYFQVNHLGHFLLTHLLSPNMKANKGGSRVVGVSSVMHWKADKTMPNDLEELNEWIRQPTGPGGEYRRSKLFNLVFTYYLAKMQLRTTDGNTIKAHCVNPGFVYSDIWRHETSETTKKVYSAYCKTTEQGAVGIVRAATEDVYGEQSGLYLVDGKPAKSSKASQNEAIATWLWEASSELTGIRPGGFGTDQQILKYTPSNVVEVQQGMQADALQAESEAIKGMGQVAASLASELDRVAQKSSSRLAQAIAGQGPVQVPSAKLSTDLKAYREQQTNALKDLVVGFQSELPLNGHLHTHVPFEAVCKFNELAKAAGERLQKRATTGVAGQSDKKETAPFDLKSFRQEQYEKLARVASALVQTEKDTLN